MFSYFDIQSTAIYDNGNKSDHYIMFFFFFVHITCYIACYVFIHDIFSHLQASLQQTAARRQLQFRVEQPDLHPQDSDINLFNHPRFK